MVKIKRNLIIILTGWSAVTTRPEVKAEVRAWTLGGLGLQLRQPSLLPFIVNMRQKWCHPDQSQSFKSKLYKKPKRF